MANKIQSEALRRVGELLSKLPKERFKDIIERRFGLKDGNRETLESVGQDYGITRERVRQIEADAFRVLNERQNIAILRPIFEYLDKFFEEHDYLIGEEKLLRTITDISQPHSSRSAVILVLTLGKPYQRFAECEKFYPHWATKKTARKTIERLVDYLAQYLDEKKQAHTLDDILKLALTKYSDVSQNTILNALDIAKPLSANVFNEWGLSHWPEVNPRGVRDKAFLVLKRTGQAQHFSEITNLINKANFSSRQAFPQTVHNELIKDNRFVLIGRGIYALSEWGYEPGVVKEVIVKILSEVKSPLSKEDIISAVLKKRQVKPGTVVINLQNNPEFEKLNDGRYSLKI